MSELDRASRLMQVWRFEHTGNDQGFSNNNRYAPLQQPINSNNSSNRNVFASNRAPAASSNNNTQPLPYQLDLEAIRTDLSAERPQWILSAYGPGRNAPEQLFGGPQTEQSFEEMRVLHYLGMRAGNPQQAVQQAESLEAATKQQIQYALEHLDDAVKYIIDAENKHPNRIDIIRESKAGVNHNNVFAQRDTPPVSQAATPAANAFGAPKQAFGQPSFGAPSQPGGGGAFGRPSALGQQQTAFSGGGFSSFANTGSTFGQPSQPPQPSAFGTISQPESRNPFGAAASTPFGAPSPASKNVFAIPSTIPPAENSFSAPNSNPFNNTSGVSSNAFGAGPNPFNSAPAAPSNAFGPTPTAFANQPSNVFATNPAPPNAFGTSPAFNAPSLSTSPFGPNTNGTSSFGGQPKQLTPSAPGNPINHPPIASYATAAPNGRLTMFKGKPVVYKDGHPGFEGHDRKWHRIWHPQGAPALNKDTEMEDAMYDDLTKAAYMSFQQTGAFPGNVMPMIPPKQEWCLWDF